MKLDSKNIISQQSQSEQFPIISSQETQSSSYKTIKKKIVTKFKLSASGSTQCTDSSSYKRSAKLSKAKDLNKKIIFDDYPSQSLELSRAQMDQFSQESHLPSQLRIMDTQSQNFGYCHSQLEDDMELKMNNQYQALLENENQYHHIYQNDQNSNSCVFQQANYDSLNLQQYNQNFNNVSRNVQNIQPSQKNASQREMIPENPVLQPRNQTIKNNNIQTNAERQRKESESNDQDSMEYNDENQIKSSQQQQQATNNNINRPERSLLGEIKQLQSPQLEEEFQFNNNNYFESQEEDEGLANNNFRIRQNQYMEEDNNHGSLFYPNDDVNFIENDEFNYEQQYTSHMYNPLEDSNRNCFSYGEATNSQQFLKQYLQPQKKLTMKEMLEEFKQEDTFSFDDQDLQSFENRQCEYMVDPQILINYSSNFTNFAKKRAILIDWMQEVSTGFNFKRETYQQSISIVDRYLERVPNVPKNQLQLVGATALLIAHKIEEVICKKNDEFITICNGGYSNSQFIQMEIDICLKLKFELNTPTPYFIMNQLMLRWDGLAEQFKEIFENDMIFFKKNNQKSFMLFSKVCQYIDCSYYSVCIYNYPIKYIITLFMYSVLHGSFIQTSHTDYKINCLNQLFERFIKNTLNLESYNDLQYVKLFTDQFLDLVICDKVPVTNQYMNRQDDQIYESYENVCSQQLYNRDFKRLFGIGD